MKDLPGATDEDIDRLLSGAPAGGARRAAPGRARGEGLDELAALVNGVRAAYQATPAADVQRRHVAAAAAVARAAAARGQAPAAKPLVVPPPAPGGWSRKASKWGRRTVFGWSLASLSTALTAVAVAAAATTGGLAATGKLPGPIQEVVAQAASGVGINLPSPARSSAASQGVSGDKGGQPSPSAGAAGAAPSGSPGDQRFGSGDDRGANGDRRGLSDIGDRSSGAGSTASRHRNCVTYASRISATLRLTAAQQETFVSLVEHDQTAVTVGVAAGGKPDLACQSAIDTARAAAASGSGTSGSGSEGSGKDGSGSGGGTVHDQSTPTPTPTGGDDAHGSGSVKNPSPTPSPTSGGHDGH